MVPSGEFLFIQFHLPVPTEPTRSPIAIQTNTLRTELDFHFGTFRGWRSRTNWEGARSSTFKFTDKNCNESVEPNGRIATVIKRRRGMCRFVTVPFLAVQKLTTLEEVSKTRTLQD